MRLLRSARWLILALLVCLTPASSFAGVFISVGFAPPVLPVYVQPPCPGPDLIWTPGYWAYGGDGYYWVPGAWVPAPYPGGLWTPGYWGYFGGVYRYNPGYWGFHVGYYGGINYGGGYLGIGFVGGEWRGGHMAYNTAVVNVNTTVIHNTYINRTVVQQNTVVNSHTAYSGGPGGVQHTATPQEQIAARETHTPPTTYQAQHENTARTQPASYAKNNGGHPATLAVAKPLPVETHTAPQASRTPATAGNGRFATTAGVSHTNTPGTMTNHSNMTQGTAPRSTPTPHYAAAPATHNAPAPRSSPPPKPKGSGHEK